MLHHVRAALIRVRELFRRRSRFSAEQDDEFSFHVDMETAENIRRGMSDADARRAAVLRFGAMQRFREETSDARGVVALDNLARDARFAFRRLHHAPGFAAGVIATLGIGIGTAAGIGTIVYGVLLRDLPYDRPEQLVRVGFHIEEAGTQGDFHPAHTYFHFAKDARAFTELGAYWTSESFNVTDGNAAERVIVASMTPNVFTMLGVRPLLGQLFVRDDTSWSNPRSAILLSEGFWRRRYGADSSIIGRRIDISHGSRIVVGVLPGSFDFPMASVDIFYPATIPVSRPQLAARGYQVIGRLRDGVGPSGAEAELRGLLATLPERFPAITTEMLANSRARVSVQALKAATVAPVRSQLLLLGVLVAVVLLIATTNVVNLFLLRTERAAQEIAIALSLGATRLAMTQRFVVEGVVLGLASALVALPAAAFALSTKFGFTEREIPRLHEVAFRADTFAFVLGSAVVIGASVGLIALTRTGLVGLFDRLRSTRSTASRAWRRAQNGLVAFQVAIALVLLVAAGLLGRSFWNLSTAAIGFKPENAMTFQVSLPWDGYRTYAANAGFHARLTDRLASLPGVSAVAVARHLPLTSRATPGATYQWRASDDASRPAVEATGNMASGDYFSVMGIPLRAGRSFQSGDLRGAPALLLSERLATRLFGTVDPVGRHVTRTVPGREDSSMEYTVVGVVGDVHWARIEDGYVPMAYFPVLRDGDGLPADSAPVPIPREVQYAIRGTQLPTVSTIQEIVKELDRRVPPTGIRTLGSLVDDATARVRLTMLLIGVAGVAALLLGVIGVYSVVAYAANGRVREFGIRLALGAAPSRVGGMVFGDGVRLVTIGTVTGLVAAFGATRLLRALLYEVEPTSVAEFAIATTLLVLVTLCATFFPARRAARTHPGVVLRGE